MRQFARHTAAAMAAVLLAITSLASAEPTEITVRVISQDAKFIGTSMGGVQIILRDADTGELLASGLTRGGTGDTARIMRPQPGRSPVLASDGAAEFSATLDIQRPRRIEAVAHGPLAQRQSANRVSATRWVVPGKDVTAGNGWMLEMPGFNVDVLSPPAHVGISGVPAKVTLRANVTMMCGCPIEPGGLWDADGYEVRALLSRGGEPVREVTLQYAGETSQFAATLELDEPGSYEAAVYAYDPSNGNTGLDSVTFSVAR